MKGNYSTQGNTLTGIIVLAALASNCATEGKLAKLGYKVRGGRLV